MVLCEERAVVNCHVAHFYLQQNDKVALHLYLSTWLFALPLSVPTAVCSASSTT